MFRTAVFLPHNRIIFLSVKGAGSGTSPCCGRDEQVRASLLLSSLAWFAVLDAAGLALPSASAALASGAAVLVPHPRVCSADSAVCAACTGRAPLLVTDANDRRCRGGGGKVPPTAARTRTRGSHRALWGGGACVRQPAGDRRGRRVLPAPHPRQADRVGVVRGEGSERARPPPTPATPGGDAPAAPCSSGATADRAGGGTVVPPLVCWCRLHHLWPLGYPVERRRLCGSRDCQSLDRRTS